MTSCSIRLGPTRATARAVRPMVPMTAKALRAGRLAASFIRLVPREGVPARRTWAIARTGRRRERVVEAEAMGRSENWVELLQRTRAKPGPSIDAVRRLFPMLYNPYHGRHRYS